MMPPVRVIAMYMTSVEPTARTCHGPRTAAESTVRTRSGVAPKWLRGPTRTLFTAIASAPAFRSSCLLYTSDAADEEERQHGHPAKSVRDDEDEAPVGAIHEHARADAEQDGRDDRKEDEERRGRIRMRDLGDEDDERGRDRVGRRLRQDLRRPHGEERAILEEADMYGFLDLGQLSGLVRRGQWPARNEPLDIALERRTRHEHAVLAGRAAHADVRAQPDDAPGVAAAGVRLAQDDDVVEIQGQRPLRGSRANRAHGAESSRAAGSRALEDREMIPSSRRSGCSGR